MMGCCSTKCTYASVAKRGCRQSASHRRYVRALEAKRVGQDQPTLNATLLPTRAVMVEQPVHPLAAQLAAQDALMRAASLRGTAACSSSG